MHIPAKQINLRGMRISLGDVTKIYDKLMQLVSAQAEHEISRIEKPDNKSEDEFSREMNDLRQRAFRITITISGQDGESLFHDDKTVFISPNLPHQIIGIYFTNVTAYEGVATHRPRNEFQVNFDFAKPPLLDASSFVSSPTPNNSYVSVKGENDAWVSSVMAAIDDVLKHKKTNSAWLHKGFIYDLGMFLFALPAAFYVIYKLYPFVDSVLTKIGSVVEAAGYIYIFLLVLFLYRFLFGYTKWAFPSMELIDNKDSANTHRMVWYGIILTLTANFLWELIKLFFKVGA